MNVMMAAFQPCMFDSKTKLPSHVFITFPPNTHTTWKCLVNKALGDDSQSFASGGALY